jgi:hypothetical protein
MFNGRIVGTANAIAAGWGNAVGRTACGSCTRLAPPTIRPRPSDPRRPCPRPPAGRSGHAPERASRFRPSSMPDSPFACPRSAVARVQGGGAVHMVMPILYEVG